MAGMVGLPSIFNTGGGIDLSKYQFRQYERTATITGSGFITGFHYDTPSSNHDKISFTTNNQQIKFDGTTDDDFTVGFDYGGTESLSNGITTYTTRYGTFHFLLTPIPFKNGGTFNATMNHITVLEYIG